MPLPAILPFLANNPLAAAIAGEVAMRGLGGLFGGESPYEQAAGQYLQAGQQLIPQLQRQAAGQPTAATQAQMGQLQQQATRMGQSYAASAQRAGIGGGRTPPGRAQQGRVQAAQLTAQGNILGQAQLSAQQQLLGIGAQGFRAQAGIEQAELAGKQQFLTGIADFMAWYRQNKNDSLTQEMFDLLRGLIPGASLATGTTAVGRTLPPRLGASV